MITRTPNSHSMAHDDHHLPFALKLLRLGLGLPALVLVILSVIAALGIHTLAAVQNQPPTGLEGHYADQQMIRYLLAFALALVIAMSPPVLWQRLGFPLYGLAFLLVLLVPLIGVAPPGSGARRWLMVAGVSIQPSELLKIALVLALASYYQIIPAEKISRPGYLIAPLALIALPLVPIFMQPDLGTALLVASIGLAIMFLAGVHGGWFIGATASLACALPLLWQNLHPYQRERVFTFLEPERDPLGAGYHLIQSKIALGSAGLWGKGPMKGTQSQLDFLPEKHTDFIFAMFTEERGFIGALFLLSLYALVLVLLAFMAMRTREQFARLVIMGLAVTLFLYVFINMGMVMGLLPVVGVPLPLMSYGGTSTLSIMFGLGIAFSAFIHRRAG